MHAFHSYDAANLEQMMYEDHRRRFQEITEFHNVDDDKVHLVEGMTHEELPAIAERIDADVVVMGAVARNRWKRMFIGATAERTLRPARRRERGQV